MRVSTVVRCALSALLLWPLGGCARERPSRQVGLGMVDTVLVELGGIPAQDLSRGQRWRMISSMGTGLPPSSFKAAQLPEPEARGAAMLQAYCVQCHWLPAPQMHAAAEWPLLLRRMYMRASTLRDRMGGPLTEGVMGEILMSGMATAEVPSPADHDSLLAYVQRNALRPAVAGEIGDDAQARLFVERCSICHETPSPRAHRASDWAAVVGRMQGNMVLMGVRALNEQEVGRVVRYLQDQAPQEQASH